MVVIILASVSMAGGMAVVGWGQQRDGLGWWALGLLLTALSYALFALRGRIPELASVVVANVLLGMVFLCALLAVRQFHGRRPPWRVGLGLLVVLLVGLLVFQHDFVARVRLVCLLLAGINLWALWDLLSSKNRWEGRGVWLLALALAFQALVLVLRVFLVKPLPGDASAGRMLQADALQTLTFFTTFMVVLLGTMGFVFLSRDRADEINRQMAAQDALTGSANRRALIAALQRDVARAVRTEEPLSLMMVDIDHFKRINDRWGHLAGDQVLRKVVEVLRARVRHQDLVGRYGGEEFMVLLPGADLMGATALARQLCSAVEATPCVFEGREIRVTVSIGVAGGSVTSLDRWDTLIAAADRALYEAKNAGRNRVVGSASVRLSCDDGDSLPGGTDASHLVA